MDTEVQKNTADIAVLDNRMSSHEAMCEERWKTCFNRFDDIDNSVGRIETILISSAGAIIVGAITLIFTMWQIHQEKIMAKNKDIKIVQEDDGNFYFTWGKDKYGFSTKENAKIALERLQNEK